MNTHVTRPAPATVNGGRGDGVYRSLIAGEWAEGEATVRNINPSDTRDIIGEYAQAGECQVADACAVAAAPFPRWSGQAAQYRADILDTIGTRILEQHEA